jgi:catechol 2,3-dioxygenase-like lactoylglutathione lyase family enzyme
LLLALTSVSCAAQSRPKIPGVSHLAVYAANMAKSEHFYVHDLGFLKGTDPEHADGVRYYVNREQFIEVLPLPANEGVNRLNSIGWITTNAEQMREYLGAHGVKVPSAVEHGADGSAWFDVKDPEGNTVEFDQPPAKVLAMSLEELYDLPGKADPIGMRIIHCGEMVHSRAKEDTFYRKLLGFRPYWYGGMKAGKVDWVSQQVPNGHDWLEYMMIHPSGQQKPAGGSGTSGPSGSGIPANMSRKELGVLDHFSLGIVDMEVAVTTLDSGGRLKDNEHVGPQIGRDGKWQYNLFDPDGTRVELMEYTAKEKPCCSPFTAVSPVLGMQP